MENPTILLVDDEENIIKSLKRGLLDDHYTILTAGNGDEALAKLEDHHVDMVISDQKMPGMSGVEFLQQVKIDYPHILTIMLTAYAEIETAMDAINEAGVYKFILKPWDEADLRITIKRALESQQLVTERDALLEQVKKRDAALKSLETEDPGITKVIRDADGYILSSE